MENFFNKERLMRNPIYSLYWIGDFTVQQWGLCFFTVPERKNPEEIKPFVSSS